VEKVTISNSWFPIHGPSNVRYGKGNNNNTVTNSQEIKLKRKSSIVRKFCSTLIQCNWKIYTRRGWRYVNR